MKISLLTTTLLSLSLMANSQVSLNASMAPPINSMFIYYDANVPSPPFVFGKSGTNNTWDFSNIAPVPGADDTTNIISPALIPGGSSFPTATHCTYEASASPSYTMIKVDASGITFLGAITDVANNGTYVPMTLNTPLQAMSFPYVYGSYGSGTGYFELFATGASVGQPTLDSIHYKGTVIGQRDVIAAGNMILPAPTGTLNAILERSINTNIDSAWGKGLLTLYQWVIAPGFPTTSTDSAFYWYTNQSLQPYAHALYDNTGLHDVNYFKSMSTVGIDESTASTPGNIYPNPVVDVINFQLPLNFRDGYTFRICNLSGQQLWNGTTNLPNINVSKLIQGIYFLQLIDKQGIVTVKTFVKN